MKFNLKLAQFLDKENLAPLMEKFLKKTVSALANGQVEELPFCFEAEYFDDGGSFMAIGQANQLQKHFKQKRVKGIGLDADGNPTKIDKKKVAIGTVSVNEEGVFEFYVEAGLLKPKYLKMAIRGIRILKKTIGNRYEIVKERSTADRPTDDQSSTDEGPDGDAAARRAARMDKIDQNVNTLGQAVGVAPDEKVKANIEKYERILEEYTRESESDGIVDPIERGHIKRIQNQLDRLKKQLAHLDGRKVQLNPRRRNKVKENMDKIMERVQKMLSEIEQGLF